MLNGVARYLAPAAQRAPGIGRDAQRRSIQERTPAAAAHLGAAAGRHQEHLLSRVVCICRREPDPAQQAPHPLELGPDERREISAGVI
jgi:hypothetical protein